MRPLTNSELVTFRRCRRKWWLGYERGLKPIGISDAPGVRNVGSLVHSGLQAYYETGNFAQADAWRALGPPPAGDALKDWNLARIMLEGYFEWLAETGVDEHLEVVGAEEIIEAPGPLGVTLRAKVDLRVRDLETGAIRIVDHKTVGDLSTPLKTFHLQTQWLHYMLVERLGNPDSGPAELTGGGIINMLRRVKRSATANPPFYGRAEVRHTDAELESYRRRIEYQYTETHHLSHVIEEHGDGHLRAYPTPDATCSWSCDYAPVCPHFDRRVGDAEAILEGGYEVTDPLAHHYR